MPRTFPPAAYTSAALAITFAAISAWQGIRLVHQRRETLAAWTTARAAAETAMNELSADAPEGVSPPEVAAQTTTMAFLRDSLDATRERIERAVSEAENELGAKRAEAEQAVKVAEESERKATNEFQAKAAARDASIEAEKEKAKVHERLWRVTYDPSRTPPWNPGPEVFVHVPWKGREVDLPNAIEGIVWFGNASGFTSAMRIGGNYPERRAAWEAGVTFCQVANRLEGPVREAKIAAEMAAAGLEPAKTHARELLSAAQGHVHRLIANRQRCEGALQGLAAYTAVASVRTGLLYLDVPALLASVAACFLALVRLALVTNWFSGRRILGHVTDRGAKMQGTPG